MSLVAQDICVDRGKRPVLHGVSLAVAPGEVVAVVGPNGAGKSTLLAALAGDLRPRRGGVSLDGVPLDRWGPEALARRRAVVRQSGALSFDFPVIEVVLMGRSPHRQAGTDDLSIARAALAQVGLAGFEDRRWDRLSGGERQRAHLARALAQVWDPRPDAPSWLLLDEPTASQDLRAGLQVLDAAAAFASQGGGVLCVLHDLNLAARYADRLCLLGGGRVHADAPPAVALTAERLSDLYGVPVQVLRPPTTPQVMVTAGGLTA